MTKKHYVMLTNAIRGVKPTLGDGMVRHQVWRECVDALSFVLSMDIPQFDHESFRIACGMKKEGT
jgi:hypothetical protein